MIVPLPAVLEIRDGAMNLTANTPILFDGNHPETRKPAELLKAAIKSARDLDLPVLPGTGSDGAISLRLDASLAGLGEEGYHLDITPAGVTVAASAKAGLFYGVQSLRQIIDQQSAGADGISLLAMHIEDRPSYSWRGYMLDSSRHFQTVDFLKRFIDALAYFKINILHWHFTDYPGWRMEIKRYPKLIEVGAVRGADEPGGTGYYTQDEIRDLVAYAADRNITIVPEIETPAHAGAAMAAYPELTCSGKAAKIGSPGLDWFHHEGLGIFCPSQEETYTFLQNVLDEVMDVFPAPVIHLGGDERPEGIWSKCDRCQARIRDENLADESELQHKFMERVTAMVNARGRRTMAWMPTVKYGIPKGQIAQDWFFNVLPDAARLGYDVVNTPDRFTYLDYPNFPGRQKPDWMHILPIEKMYEFEPTPADLPDELKPRVIGSETCLWTEFVQQEDVDIASFPRTLAFAEVMWTPTERRSWDDFEKRMKAMEAPMAKMGFRYATPEIEQAHSPKLPASIETSMAWEAPYAPEAGFDGRFTRFFWSTKPPKAGDHYTVTLEKPVNARRIRLYTGSDISTDDWLRDGILEVSHDGATFQPVATVDAPMVESTDLSGPVKAIRIRVNGPQEQRLAIREIVVD